MKPLLACALFVLAACSHHSPPPQQPTDTDAAVDPTLPSWAPHSCITYHKAVVKLTGCTQVAQAVRDQVSAKYDTDTKTWHDMQNQTQADLDQVKVACSDDAAAVNAQITSDCTKGIGETPVEAQ
ncbi:MAG: hypothetical protein ABI467_00470 [Kofleriaceae bacterium]